MEAIQAKSVTIQLGGDGQEIKISPLKVGQLPAFTRHIQPLFGRELDFSNPAVFVELLGTHADTILEALVAATPLTREQVDNLDLDDVVEVIAAVIEVNANFFAQRLTPRFNQTLSKMTSTLSGLKPSKS